MIQHAFKPQLFPFTQKKNGKEYSAWRVRYEDKNGKRKLKQFPTEREAKDFHDLEVINAKNRDIQFTSVTTKLSREQLEEAESAFHALGEGYTLKEAVEYFLKYHRPADKEMPLSEAVFRYTEAKELGNSVKQVRGRTLRQIKSTLEIFKGHFDGNLNLGEIGTPEVMAFLNSRKAKDGKTAASNKSFNNVLSVLNQFFEYCSESKGEDRHEESKLKTRWIMLNPCEGIKRKPLQNDSIPEIMTAKQCQKLMKEVAAFKGGQLVPYFALALFAGIRTGDEIVKLANHPKRESLINFQTKKIHITAEIAKTRKSRQIVIQPSLAKWLKAFPVPIFPVNADRDIKRFRKSHSIGHDVMRHTFISHHVAKFKSVGRTALEAGNTESIIKEHYLNLVSNAQGQAFFKIEPPKTEGKVIKFKEASA